ncbi:MAG: hypothetical protein WCJ13_02460 [Coriobacteriia bacterium]
MDEKHLGSAFGPLLRDEGIREDAEAVAARVGISLRIAQEMKRAQRTPTPPLLV